MLCSIHSHSHPKLLLTGFVLTGAIAPALAQSVLTQHGETVIASGDAVPGFPTGAVIAPGFTALGAAIDRNGTMVFRARVTQNAALGIDSTNDGALFVGRNLGDLRLCVRAGDQAPGCAAGTLLRSNLAAASNGLGTNPRISPTGEILFFRSAIYDPTTPANTPSNANTALFWGSVGNLQLLAREGDTVPFLGNGERYGDIVFTHQSNKINSSGAVVLHNILQTGGGVNSSNDSMLVTGLPGSLQLIVREGSVWSGSQNSELTGPVTTLAQLNESGAVLHEVQLALGSGTVPVTAANDRLLAMWVAGTDLTLCREGDQAPGLPTGVVFADAVVRRHQRLLMERQRPDGRARPSRRWRHDGRRRRHRALPRRSRCTQQGVPSRGSRPGPAGRRDVRRGHRRQHRHRRQRSHPVHHVARGLGHHG